MAPGRPYFSLREPAVWIKRMAARKRHLRAGRKIYLRHVDSEGETG
jgi:hypothetical protein